MASASDPGLRDQGALHEALAFAEELADAARLMAMRRACSPLQIVAKYDGSPVTIVDGDIAHVLGELTVERYPGHAIHLGSVDEAARTPAWVFDPIARTRGFPAGSELLATSIALVDGLRPVLAVVDLPVLRERWTGTAGAKHFNGRLHDVARRVLARRTRGGRAAGARLHLALLRRRLLCLRSSRVGPLRPRRGGRFATEGLHGAGVRRGGRGRDRHRLDRRAARAAIRWSRRGRGDAAAAP
jgi:fructose-1,6-bisphosphatase/inositol monophosphatase family enzyme